MIKEDFKIVIQGKKTIDGLLIDMSSEYTFTEQEALAVLDTVLVSIENDFDYNPVDLMLRYITCHYSGRPEDIVKDVDRFFYGQPQEECPSSPSCCV